MFSFYISEVVWYLAGMYGFSYHFTYTLYSHMICDTQHSIGLYHCWTIACKIILFVLTAQLVDVWGLEYGSGHATPPHGFH